MDSLDDAWELIHSQLPIQDTNDLKSLLMIYHNTLVVEKEQTNENNS